MTTGFLGKLIIEVVVSLEALQCFGCQFPDASDDPPVINIRVYSLPCKAGSIIFRNIFTHVSDHTVSLTQDSEIIAVKAIAKSSP